MPGKSRCLLARMVLHLPTLMRPGSKRNTSRVARGTQQSGVHARADGRPLQRARLNGAYGGAFNGAYNAGYPHFIGIGPDGRMLTQPLQQVQPQIPYQFTTVGPLPPGTGAMGYAAAMQSQVHSQFQHQAQTLAMHRLHALHAQKLQLSKKCSSSTSTRIVLDGSRQAIGLLRWKHTHRHRRRLEPSVW